MEEKNKFTASSKYFTISVYTIITFLILCLIIKTVFFWSSTSAFISTLLSTLSPFFLGVLIAFLINPLVSWVRNTVLSKWLHLKNKALGKILSIFISYIAVIAVITLGLIYIIPAIINSLQMLLAQVPEWSDSITRFITEISKKYPNVNFDLLLKNIDKADSSLQHFLQKFISNLTTTVILTGVSIVKFVFNFIVAIIVSCYLLIDKKMQGRSFKRTLYAFVPKQKADSICKVVRRAITIFSNFFTGKMIDSLIMGILCFFLMIIISFFGVPGFRSCALLIGIIVAVTNMIPYFGPFIGGIPSILLLCIYSPKSALVFTILIIVLQQLDGNLIGPKILGDSTGLRPLWIIFAITIGGWLGGVVGMLLGVPCVATLSGLLGDAVDKRLDDKNIYLPVVVNEKVRPKNAENKKK